MLSKECDRRNLFLTIVVRWVNNNYRMMPKSSKRRVSFLSQWWYSCFLCCVVWHLWVRYCDDIYYYDIIRWYSIDNWIIHPNKSLVEMLNTNTHKSTVSHGQLKCLKSQFYQLILLKFYSILFNPACRAINCDIYEWGNVMISIIMNF